MEVGPRLTEKVGDRVTKVIKKIEVAYFCHPNQKIH